MSNKCIKFTFHALERMKERNIDPDLILEHKHEAIRLYPPNIYHSDTTQIFRIDDIWLVAAMHGGDCKIVTAYRRNHI